MNTYFKAWSLTLFLKLALASALPLIADEAYYWVWSLFPQFSYFDHPPMTAWLLYLGHFLDWGQSLVRWPGVILGHSLWLIWFFIFQQLKIEMETYKVWFYLTLISPFLGFGTLLLTPDLPLLVFWSLSLLFYLKYLERPSVKYALGLGVSLGLGFLSKYLIVLFLPLTLYSMWRNKVLHRFPWKHLHIIGISGFIFCLPVLYWNSKNQWSSFHFQFNHGLKQAGFSWQWPVEYFFGQVLILFPLVVWAAVKNKDPRMKILKSFAWGPLIFFFLTSFRAPVEGNWPIMAYPTVYALALTGSWSWRKHFLVLGFWLSLYFTLGFAMIFSAHQFVHGKVSEPFLYRSFSPLVEVYRPLYAINYQLASSLWFNSRKPVYKLKDGSRYDFFDTLDHGYPSENSFFLIKQRHHDLPEWILKEGWKIKEVENLPHDYLILEVKK